MFRCKAGLSKHPAECRDLVARVQTARIRQNPDPRHADELLPGTEAGFRLSNATRNVSGPRIATRNVAVVMLEIFFEAFLARGLEGRMNLCAGSERRISVS